MRWRLPGARTTLPASVALLLLPILVAPQQLQEHDDRPSTVSAPYPPAGRAFEYDPLATIHVKSNDASALATMALAGSGRAVRAHPAPASSSSAGLAPQLHARSLQDWEVEDFVLLATVDGSIHARDRKTGAARWALEVPSSPMIESIYHRANHSSFDRTQPEDDFLWIVEPSQDGSLYIYSPDPDAGLQRLGLTVKELVEQTPYSGIDPAVTYTARKETTLYTVDARTGNILRVFSSRGPISSGQGGCRKVDAFDQESDECDSPSGTLVLGRVEYAVAIQNTETGDAICTLKYSEWTANNRDMDLQSQYFRTMDQSHIYSMHDGVVLGFDHSRMDRPRYTQRFSTPVVRVFDVARPVNVESPDAAPPLVLLSQPAQPPDPDYGPLNDERDARVWIDRTEGGGWYAMSEETYPLVTGRAKMAQCYEKDYLRYGQPLNSLSAGQQRDALSGVHSLNGPRIVRNIPSISGPSHHLELNNNDTPRELIRSPSELALPPALRHSTIIRKGWDNAVDIFVTLLLLFFGAFIYFNSHNIQELAKQKLDIKNIMASYAQPPLSTPASPVVGATFKRDASPMRPVANFTVDVEVPDEPQGGDETPRPKRDRSLAVPGSTPRVKIREPSRGPDDEEDLDDPTANEDAEKPKKARRGRRGGKAHRRRKKPGTDGESQAQPDRVVEEVNNLQPPSRLEPDVQLVRSVSNEFVEMDGVLRIGRLKVFSDVVLGHGSHGTVVYRGSFDGRDVAVKRMLVEFYDIASHEVGLLQESDDHNNVIRYFCREQATGFLYIALELCPASLQDLIERPGDYPQLVQTGLDLPDILRQIIAGVRYLHSLKIVHRDLKPQNILVAMPRGRTGSRSLRLLISDFGLCKKLDDNQSSFRATTAHAAGTSGWRAPELLVDDDNRSAIQGESQHTESSEPAVVDPQTNRRATRAIDIFSLGCVFYYVLTRGSHPFDKNGKFMREANIVKGNFNLDELQRLGDYAFEADDLIRSMLCLEPRQRPDASAVLMHPFFWNPSDRLSFLCDVSDHFEFEPRDPPSDALLCLESVAPDVMGPDLDFLRLLPKDFKDNLGKQRKYTGSKMLDLLRALRNKRNHYNDMPEHLKAHVGGLPEGYLNFWTVRFPSLLMSCHWVIGELRLTKIDRFKRYFTPVE
ncbi:bifunctional endoribonuclease/protein kinase IRE1 [Aspergillus clavatus NRRL 1]|uniref:non-specific serine/threonine protein kinase n=1 Tax=Aspergillus clavatus (strain ATCC 1007 / CBS 513.65 / DSM 816 / NCTC 3887 / NRRL 1 / QM 1276 / 107) TaxID=344612 RepID=A1CSC3_ASPCL|nr:protein kinase and ribonuclease Ire1, putative [Aspergillus clavatus NRRL 1]EAW08544.1 protein kinase and ribonuclease Ire1, putative [Aspergillus clavatus NRRL 1]